MIKEINKILKNLTGKYEKLDYDTYKEMLGYFPSIGKEYVSMLADKRCIKSDTIKLEDKDYWGLRACLNFNYNDIDICDFYGVKKIEDKFPYGGEDVNFFYSLDKAEEILNKLSIRPKYLLLMGKNIYFIFQPKQKINLKSDEDYINLVHSFIDYIHEYENEGLNFIGWNLKNKEMVESMTEKESNTNFTKELFDQKTEYMW